MQELSNQVTGGTLTADEFNEIPQELENLIESAGQVLSGVDLEQVVKAVSSYSAGGNYYSDSGSANNYVLSPLAPRVGIPSLQEGMVFTFIPSVTNTGPSTATVNALSSLSILTPTGAALSGGELVGGIVAQIIYDGTQYKLYNAASSASFPKGHIHGLTISNNSVDPDNDIDFNIGEAKDLSNTINIANNSVITKQIDAVWDSGTGVGGMASSVALAPSKTYHCFILADAAGNTDAGFDDDPTGANLLADANVIAAGFAYLRRVGSFVTESTSTIPQFIQIGDDFILAEDVSEITFTEPPDSLSTGEVAEVNIPSKINAIAQGNVFLDHTSTSIVRLRVSSVDLPNVAPTNDNKTLANGPTSTAFEGRQSTFVKTLVDHPAVTDRGEIRFRSDAPTGGGGAAVNVSYTITGWTDTRDRS